MEKLVDAHEMAALLSMERPAVYRLVHERKIPVVDIGHRTKRFAPSKVYAALTERTGEINAIENS